MAPLMIKDMYLGKIDGYNEFLEYGQDTCKGLFFEFPNVSIDKLLDGSTYYIFGNKGTGKTMLLKYIESKILENPETNFTEFIRFKKDVDTEQRNLLKRTAVPSNSFEEVIESNIPTDISLNCTLAWQVYLIKVIINRLSPKRVVKDFLIKFTKMLQKKCQKHFHAPDTQTGGLLAAT